MDLHPDSDAPNIPNAAKPPPDNDSVSDCEATEIAAAVNHWISEGNPNADD